MSDGAENVRRVREYLHPFSEPHTSTITASSSRTSASVDGKGNRSARHLWSRRSTKWSADDSSRSSRCSGPYAVLIFCCRPGRRSSTRIWTTHSAVGIRNSGRNHKRRSQSARWLDPRPSDAPLSQHAHRRHIRWRCQPAYQRQKITLLARPQLGKTPMLRRPAPKYLSSMERPRLTSTKTIS
jgi:hypothetical protein